MRKEYGKINDNERYRIGNRIAWITVLMNILLAIGKIAVGLISNSTAILADGVHTVSDIISSIGIIISFLIAKKPEDIDHHYGHEKAESIAGFVLSLLLISVGIKIGYSAVLIIFSGTIKTPGVLAIWAALISVFAKELQFRIAFYGGKKINSSALIADAWHHRSDALSSIAALIGIVGARMGYKVLDPIAGLIVSIIVVKVGIQLFLQGYRELMDTSIEEGKLYKLAHKLLENSQINNINEIRTRRHGTKVFVDIKICVDPHLTVSEGHDVAEEVENIIYNSIDNVKDVLVHVNPCKSDETKCSDCDRKTSRFIRGK